MIQNFKPYTKAKLVESYTIQVQKTDDKGQPVTTNVAVMVQAPKLDEKGQPLMTNGVAVMMDVPQLDAKGQPVMTNVAVMVDQKVEDKPSCKARWRRRSPSKCSAPTAAATPTPTPRIRLKIPRRSPTFCRCSPFSPSAAA
jgi:hypothetical protein